jgi:membrane protease YdiL (CAAX protease family)
LFRFGFQEMLLKQLPKAIIKRIAPSQLSSVDSKAAKAARVLITATAFSLAHALHPGYGWPSCSLARLINTFAAGLIISTIQETTGSPILAMAFHSGYNITDAYQNDTLGITIHCVPAIPGVRT